MRFLIISLLLIILLQAKSYAQSDSTMEWQVSLGTFPKKVLGAFDHYYDLHIQLDYQIKNKHWLSSRTSLMLNKQHFGHQYTSLYMVDYAFQLPDTNIFFTQEVNLAGISKNGSALAQEFRYELKFKLIKQYLMINLSWALGAHYTWNTLDDGSKKNVLFATLSFGTEFESRYKNFSLTLQPINLSYIQNNQWLGGWSFYPLVRIGYYFPQKREK